MSKNHETEGRAERIRDGVLDADATGMVADEELISTLHAMLPPDHQAHGAVDGLKAEFQRGQRDWKSIEKHIGVLRELPELKAIVLNWWDSPNVQRIVADIDHMGL